MDQDSVSEQKVYLVRRASSFLILVLPLFKLFKYECTTNVHSSLLHVQYFNSDPVYVPPPIVNS